MFEDVTSIHAFSFQVLINNVTIYTQCFKWSQEGDCKGYGSFVDSGGGKCVLWLGGGGCER